MISKIKLKYLSEETDKEDDYIPQRNRKQEVVYFYKQLKTNHNIPISKTKV